jgi:LmbE family N-acetylglucosaminyl deacetylase
MGPPRRRGVHLRRTDGHLPPARRSRRGPHRDARRSRHHRPENLATGPARSVAHAELRNSLAALDVFELHLLGYEDGHCERGDGTQAIARHITDIDPDLIVTFGPDGMTGHPDHRTISRWTTDAWAATRPDADLLYATVTADFHRGWGPINDQIGLWADQPDPPCTAAADLALNTRLPDTLLDLKVAALEAHVSQTRPLIELLGPATYRQWWRTESFRRPLPGNREIPSSRTQDHRRSGRCLNVESQSEAAETAVSLRKHPMPVARSQHDNNA